MNEIKDMIAKIEFIEQNKNLQIPAQGSLYDDVQILVEDLTEKLNELITEIEQ